MRFQRGLQIGKRTLGQGLQVGQTKAAITAAKHGVERGLPYLQRLGRKRLAHRVRQGRPLRSGFRPETGGRQPRRKQFELKFKVPRRYRTIGNQRIRLRPKAKRDLMSGQEPAQFGRVVGFQPILPQQDRRHHFQARLIAGEC